VALYHIAAEAPRLRVVVVRIVVVVVVVVLACAEHEPVVQGAHRVPHLAVVVPELTVRVGLGGVVDRRHPVVARVVPHFSALFVLLRSPNEDLF
jgi:hypothetical protein